MKNANRARRSCGSLAAILLLVLGTLQLQEPAAAAPATAKQQARREFKQGNAAFAKDNFGQALEHYQKAYALLPLPGFLFNIGQCYRNLNQYEQAISHYRLYLQKKPDAGNRAAVEQLLEELEQKVGSAQQAPPDPAKPSEPPAEPSAEPLVPEYSPEGQPPPLVQIERQQPPPPAPAPSTPLYKRWWFWTSIAVLAAGGAAAGVYFGTRSSGSTLPDSPYPVLDFSL